MAKHSYRVANGNLYATRKEALAAFPDERPVKVRPVVLSDLVIWTSLFGDMRERLAELTGDDSMLDVGALHDAIAGGTLRDKASASLNRIALDLGIKTGELGYTVHDE